MKKIQLLWPASTALALFAVAASHKNVNDAALAGSTQELYRRIEAIEANPQAPIGCVLAFVGKRVPEGWLACDGRPLNSKLYPKLYAAIGTIHGTGGAQTAEGLQGDFNIPDLRGVFLRGVDAGKGLDTDPRQAPSNESRGCDLLGSRQDYATARPKVAFVTDTSGNHSHNPQGGELVFSDGNETSADEDGTAGQTNLTYRKPLAPAGAHTHEIASGGDKETRPVNVSVQFIVRAK